MTESEYDAFGAGHASISLSALLGMTAADRMQGNDKKAHVALIEMEQWEEELPLKH